MMKRLEMFPRPSSGVSLRVCTSLPVNSTLIALALQLGDLQSEGNFGINKKDITKVSECVIICAFQSEEAGWWKNYGQMNPPVAQSVAQG